MTKNKHPQSKKDRIEIEIKHREKKKTKSTRVRIKDQIRDEETKDELQGYIG